MQGEATHIDNEKRKMLKKLMGFSSYDFFIAISMTIE